MRREAPIKHHQCVDQRMALSHLPHVGQHRSMPIQRSTLTSVPPMRSQLRRNAHRCNPMGTSAARRSTSALPIRRKLRKNGYRRFGKWITFTNAGPYHGSKMAGYFNLYDASLQGMLMAHLIDPDRLLARIVAQSAVLPLRDDPNRLTSQTTGRVWLTRNNIALVRTSARIPRRDMVMFHRRLV